MDTTRFCIGLGILLAGLGGLIAVGAVLTGLGVPTGVDADSLIVGAGIAVAGAVAAFQLGTIRREALAEEDPQRR